MKIVWSKKRNLPDEMSQRDQIKKFIFKKETNKLKKYAVLSKVLVNMRLIKLDPALISTYSVFSLSHV